MTIAPFPPAPPAPSRAQDNEVFNARMAAMFGFIEQLPDEFNAFAAAVVDLVAVAFTATSASNVAIGVGAKAFAASPGAAFLPGHFVLITSRGAPAKYLRATVTSYDRATGALAVVATTAVGDGSRADWDIALTVGEGAGLGSPAFTGTPTAPTAAAGTNTTQLATTGFVQAAVAALVANSPAALDTLNELAAALGNDANFAATVTTALAAKANTADLGTMAFRARATAAQVAARSADVGITADRIREALAPLAVAYAATLEIDAEARANFTVSLTGNATLTIANPIPGAVLVIRVVGNDATARTLAFNSNFKGPLPTLADITATKAYDLYVRMRSATDWGITAVPAS